MKIICENAAKRYESEGNTVDAVKNCTAVFESGRIACIVGVSGSGKSTLLEMLSLNLAPDSGRILFDGKDVTALLENEQNRLKSEMIGYLPQSLGLIPILTAGENIQLPGMISGKKRKINPETVSRLGIGEVLDRLPDEMSGGQRQRTALVREIMREPKIFLADEPTSALDSENIAVVIGILKELRDRGCAVIITTHDERICAAADDIYLMSDGVLHIPRNERNA
ncbi:MAG: ATP-binding cassette domain-containing protein [Clostridia bacterium]|nr:ATP-binding cassette domain-containing protein [Clostridia bacterium]